MKPACLWDASITLQIKVSFASNGQYSEGHTKSIELELAQIQKAAIRSELDHEYKYRFLYVSDHGDVLPLYDRKQTGTAGAGQLLLTFSGHPGSGFEHCEAERQALTYGSQYQASFLPEMGNGAPYKVKVHATYRDFLPLDFDLTVKYLPNLDGKTKFVDLGTHIFYKDPHGKPQVPYKFILANVLDNELDDDLDSYRMVLNDGLVDYYQLENQENII